MCWGFVFGTAFLSLHVLVSQMPISFTTGRETFKTEENRTMVDPERCNSSTMVDPVGRGGAQGVETTKRCTRVPVP